MLIDMSTRGYQVRRIVTGLNAQRESEVSIIGPCTNRRDIEGWPGMFVNELWVTNESPVDNSGSEDAALRPIRHDPTPGGTIFRVVEIPPEADLKVDADATFAAMGSANRPTDKDKSRHFSMHKTDSIDYTVVISGECTMLLEKGEVQIRQGDCIVQRGTNHGWVNRSTAPCVIAFILIDAIPR
jgi:mannose-6-phosphate isomerase-like protein (cupin superfamily)